MNQVIKFLKAEDGQDLIEYALLAALIALAAVVAMQATGTSINGVFNWIAGHLNSSVSGGGRSASRPHLPFSGSVTMNRILKDVAHLLRDDEGQDLIEYALLAALIALAAVVAMQATGTSINGVFNSIAGQLTSSVSGS